MLSEMTAVLDGWGNERNLYLSGKVSDIYAAWVNVGRARDGERDGFVYLPGVLDEDLTRESKKPVAGWGSQSNAWWELYPDAYDAVRKLALSFKANREQWPEPMQKPEPPVVFEPEDGFSLG